MRATLGRPQRLGPLRQRRQRASAIVALVGHACGADDTASPSANSASSVAASSIDAASTSTIEPPPVPDSTPPSSQIEAVAGSLDAAELGAPYLGGLTFDWPQNCAVPVLEEVLKSSKTATLQYNLGLRAEGQNLIVSFDDLVVTTFDGSPVPAGMGEAVRSLFALPSFLVGTDGTVLDVIGMAALIGQIEATAADSDFEVAPELAGLLKETVANKYWGSWVGMWATWEVFDDANEIGESELPVSGGVAVSDVEMNSLGSTDDSLVALRGTITLDGADFTVALRGTLPTVISTVSAAETSAISGQRVIVVEVVIDPTTLQPSSAFTSIDVDLTLDGETSSELEERRWTFDWTACA